MILYRTTADTGSRRRRYPPRRRHCVRLLSVAQRSALVSWPRGSDVSMRRPRTVGERPPSDQVPTQSVFMLTEHTSVC